jgi:hypothetical protein
MAKFEIKFLETTTQLITSIVEAENESDAIDLFDNQPFMYEVDREHPDSEETQDWCHDIKSIKRL